MSNNGDNLEIVDDYPNKMDCAEMPTPSYSTRRTRHPPERYFVLVKNPRLILSKEGR